MAISQTRWSLRLLSGDIHTSEVFSLQAHVQIHGVQAFSRKLTWCLHTQTKATKVHRLHLMQLKRMHRDIRSEGKLKRCGAHASLQPRAQLCNPIKRLQLGLKRWGLKMKALVVCTVIIMILVGAALACLWLNSGRYIWFFAEILDIFIFMDLVKKFLSALLWSCNKPEFAACCRVVG